MGYSPGCPRRPLNWGSKISKSVFEFGPFCLDPSRRELRRADDDISLTPRAFDTLLALVEREGALVEKEDLLRRVWPQVHVSHATLTQNVYTIRKALERHDPSTEYVETIPRRGYRIAVPVQTSTGAVDPTVRSVPRELAVLPFVPLGVSAEERFVGLGMADALITRLSALRQITVRPTSAILQFSDNPRGALEVGRTLGVEAVLEGTVQMIPRRVRVTVQLVDVYDASTIWADSFDTERTDLLCVEDEISRRVIDALRLHLSREDERRLASPATANVEAHRAYVKGRYHWNARTATDLKKAIAHFENAIRHDDRYVLAYAGLADSWALLPLYGSERPADVFPRVRNAAMKALAIDDTSAEANTSLAYVHLFFDWNSPEAEAGFARAIGSNPGYPTAHHWLAFLHASQARHDESVASAMRALELDPLSLAINADLGLVLYFARRFDEAIEQFRVTLELNADFAYARFGLALACAASGRIDEAILESRRAVALSPGGSAMLAALGYAYGVGGRDAEAREVLGQLASLAGSPSQHASRAAVVHAGLGDHAAALSRLRDACEERSRFVVFLRVWPVFDRIRAEPEFETLVRRVAGRPV